ncbi:M14 family zinc carboxypeptidase, partial [Acidobacteriota bacterium]
MRLKDPDGEWKLCDFDPRLMVRREKDDKGSFYRVLDEGVDNDGDGQVNEDPPFTRFISNRNYPAFWASLDGRFRGRGDYPLQEHNAKLLVDFILSRPNISQIESYHTTSGIHLRPYAARSDKDFPSQDLQDYNAVLGKGTEITTYPVASIYNDFTTILPRVAPDEQPNVRHGVFVDWSYVHLGLFSVTTELWTMEPFVNEIGWGDIPRDKPLFAIPGRYNRPDVQAVVLKWLDQHEGDKDLREQGFIDWKPYTHDTLGEVEIGGFTRYWLRNPPPGPYFERVVKDQAIFAVTRVLMSPLVKIKKVEVKQESSSAGSWRITVTANNEGYLDTSLQQARIAGVAKPDRLSIQLPLGAKTMDKKSVDFSFIRGTRGSAFKSLYRAVWHVDASEGTKVTVIARSEKGGVDRREVKLVAPKQ